MKQWDDLRYVLAVAENGSITAGAKALGVDQSTVSRRLNAYEKALGRKLFLETKKRHQLTPFGEICVATARRIAADMTQMTHALRIQDHSLQGTIRIYTEGLLTSHLLLTLIRPFMENYPDLNFRISTENDHSPHFQADIGFFATNHPDPDHFGRHLATASFASYACADYVEKCNGRIEEMVWLNWDDGSDQPVWPRLSPHIPPEKCRIRHTSVSALIDAAKIGLGATILPCYMGELDPNLVRLDPGHIVSQRDIWLFVQPDLRHIPKIRAFLDHIYHHMSELRPIIETDLVTAKGSPLNKGSL